MVNQKRKIFFVIVAAGSGSRFGSDIPKQFLPLDGKPVVVHSIETVAHALPDARIVLVLSDYGRELWGDIVRRYNYESPAVVTGGAARTDSVRNALRACLALGCTDEDIIMVHDGARPLVTEDLLLRMLAAMEQSPAAIPACPLTDSIVEEGSEGHWRGADRSRFKTVQTPQAFHAGTLIGAYNASESDARSYTDDASVVEGVTGIFPTIVPGEPTNIKITNPDDLLIAGILLSRRK